MNDELRAIAAEITRRRFGSHNLEPGVLDKLTDDHEERLDNIMTAALIDELTRLGKLDEFDRYTDTPNADIDAYLSRNIPHFEHWRSNVVRKAFNHLVGNR